MRFDRLNHLVRMPVVVGDAPFRFLFDTGIGVNVVSPGLAEELGLAQVGESFAGRRMSGQRVDVPLVYLPPLRVDGQVLRDQVAGVVDLDDHEGPTPRFSGILGLTAFATTPVTVDAAAETITLGDPGPVAQWVPLDIRTDGPSTDPFAEPALPGGRTIAVELDCGSDCLILDAGWLDRGEVEVSGSLETSAGTDETGHDWVRRRGRLQGAVHFAAAPETLQADPPVIFQDIIHDGLIGSDHLDRFRYTVDVTGARLGLSPHTAGRGDDAQPEDGILRAWE
jgi:hypothetical protein